MKTFFKLLLLVFVIFIFLILGNMLRCMSNRSGACPGWCKIKETSCLTSECSVAVKCQAPSAGGYQELINNWLTEKSNGKIKL